MKDIVYPVSRAAAQKQSALRRTVIMQAVAALFGAMLVRTSVFSLLFPLGTAFCAGVKKEYSISALIGVFAGSLLLSGNANAAVYIGAATVATALKWVLDIVSENELLMSVVSAFSGGAFGGICRIFGVDFTAEAMARSIGETLIAAAGAYFICEFFAVLDSGKKAARLNMNEVVTVLFFIATVLAAMSPYTVLSFSAARFICGSIIIFAARYGRTPIGAAAGVILGISMGASYPKCFFIIGAYALGGIMCGVLSKKGTLAAVLGYVGGVCAVLSAFYGNEYFGVILTETALTGIAFVVCPKKIHVIFSNFFSPSPQLARVDGLRRNLIMRMQFASAALTDVSEAVEEVSERLKKMNMPTIYDVFVQTENEACANCGLRIHCYETLKSKTYEAMLQMTRTMRKKGKLNNSDYPEKWVSRCLEPQAVAESLYRNFMMYESRCEAEMRISQIRTAVSDQMAGLSDMLYDMSEEMNVAERYDVAAAECIGEKLQKMGVRPSDVCCKLDASDRMSVEICVRREDIVPISKSELISAVDNICARRFTTPCIVNAGARQLITMTEKTGYSIEIGVAQFCCKNEKLCGDSYSYFNTSNGKCVMLLSDGMGCGGRAAVDSNMVSGLMSRLVKAGFGYECSLKLLNSAMMFKSNDESLATVDITAVDLFSGQADFFKAGAPETLVLKGRKTGRASCKSYPAGIVRDVSFDRTTAVLSDGDIIIMMSDGVSISADEGGDNWVEQLARSNRKMNAQGLADMLAQAAVRRRNDGHEDDVTVMVGIVRKCDER